MQPRKKSTANPSGSLAKTAAPRAVGLSRKEELLLAGSDVRLNITRWDTQNMALAMAVNDDVPVDFLRNGAPRAHRAVKSLHRHYLHSRRVQGKKSNDVSDLLPFQEYAWGCSLLAQDGAVGEVGDALIVCYGRECEDRITFSELRELMNSHTDFRKKLALGQEMALSKVREYFEEHASGIPKTLDRRKMLTALEGAGLVVEFNLERFLRDMRRFDSWDEESVLSLDYPMPETT